MVNDLYTKYQRMRTGYCSTTALLDSATISVNATVIVTVTVTVTVTAAVTRTTITPITEVSDVYASNALKVNEVGCSRRRRLEMDLIKIYVRK